VDAAALGALHVLVERVVELQTARLAPPGDAMPLVLTGWSAAHVMAALWVDGPLSRRDVGLGLDARTLSTLVARRLGHMFAAAGTPSHVVDLAEEALKRS